MPVRARLRSIILPVLRDRFQIASSSGSLFVLQPHGTNEPVAINGIRLQCLELPTARKVRILVDVLLAT